jgi:hypothetical protein
MRQRQCGCGQHSMSSGPCEQCQQAQVPSEVHEVLRTPGQPLDGASRNFMEWRFQHDFSQIRIHSGQRAACSASAVNALAYTVGRDIVFGAGQYAPHTASGRQLLAHELVHTIQTMDHSPLRIGDPESAAEREARSASLTLESDGGVREIRARGAGLERQAAPAQPAEKTRPEDFGISLVVMDHGATAAHAAAQQRLDQMFRDLQPANLGQLQSDGVTTVELHVIPESKKLTDLPEYASLTGTRTPDGRLWDDARGAGGARVGLTLRYAVAEEELLRTHPHGAAIGLGILGGALFGAVGAFAGFGIGSLGRDKGKGGREAAGAIAGGVLLGGLGIAGGIAVGNIADKQSESGYGVGHIATHEGGHTAELALTPAQHAQVVMLYAERKNAGGPWLPPTDYTSSNENEYFAQSVAAFFEAPTAESDRDFFTPAWLRKNDPGMYRLLMEVYKEGEQRPGQQRLNDRLENRYAGRAAA